MGMYDTFPTGDQVKCFPVPCFYYSASHDKLFHTMLGYMGGELRYFGTETPMPLKTWWYKYPDNLLIIDTTDTDFYPDTHTEPIIHVIQNKMYVQTYDSLEEFLNTDYTWEMVIDYNGRQIFNILDKNDVAEFIKNNIAFQKASCTIREKYREEISQPLKYLQSKHSKAEIVDEEFNQIKQKADEAYTMQNAEITEVMLRYMNQYIPVGTQKRQSVLENIGAYLDCYKIHTQRNNAEIVTAIKTEFKNTILSQTDITLKDYLDWYEPDTQDEIDEITNLWEGISKD